MAIFSRRTSDPGLDRKLFLTVPGWLDSEIINAPGTCPSTVTLPGKLLSAGNLGPSSHSQSFSQVSGTHSQVCPAPAGLGRVGQMSSVWLNLSVFPAFPVPGT